MAPLDWEEYKNIYNETGLDIDGRKKILGDCAASAQKIMEHYLGFCYSIPGFRDLLQDDQMGVLKGA